jgi:aarF domain-containing kinase
VILRRFVGVVGKWRNFKSDVVGIVDELVGRIFEEMDYSKEAESCERFREMYAAHGDAGVGLAGLVSAPRVVDFLSTPTVLTMEWVQGLRLTDVSLMQARGITPNEVLDRGLRASLHQLLSSGFMHTDPHPGNLIVAENGGLTYLDFGMTVEVPIETRRAMIRGLIGFVNRDARGLVDDLKVMDFLPPHVDRAAAEEALRSVFAGESTTKVRNSNDFMGVVSQLSTALMKHGFRLPPYFSRILRALAALEGTATTIDPSFRVVDRSYPFVLSRVLSDRSPEMRESLRRLLLSDDGTIRYKRLIRLIRAYGVETTPMASSDATAKSDCRQALEKIVVGVTELVSGERATTNGEEEARRATKVAMEDALKFLLSERGASTRQKLINDFFSALETLLARDARRDGENASDDEFTLDNAIEAIRSTIIALSDNPDLWIPVLGRAALDAETLRVARHSKRFARQRLARQPSRRRTHRRVRRQGTRETFHTRAHET